MGWKQTTETHSKWLQGIFALCPELTRAERIALYLEARGMADSMAGPRLGNSEGYDARYWSIYVNSLRTIVAGMSNATKLFGEEQTQSVDEEEKKQERCPAKHKFAGNAERVDCQLEKYHDGDHDWGGYTDEDPPETDAAAKVRIALYRKKAAAAEAAEAERRKKK